MVCACGQRGLRTRPWLVRAVLAGMASAAIAASGARAQERLAPSGFDHSAFDAVLRAHVTHAGVRYAALKADRAALDRYVAALAATGAAEFDAWPRTEQVAYLINAYNALTIRQVVDRYPIRRRLFSARGLVRPANSVWQVPGFFDGIRHRVAGRDLTLDDIEHEWLRRRLDEPRVHFALVCAARSCPPLRREAYAADRLDAQLDDQARLFFNDPALNVFDRASGEVRLSSILRWFGEDFARYAPAEGFRGSTDERGSLAFAARFLPAATAGWLRTATYSIRYIDYDWSLNDAGTP
jgi:hypothetical protein